MGVGRIAAGLRVRVARALARRRARRLMKKGYAQMGRINLEWAELGLSADERDLSRYESGLKSLN